MFNYSKDGITVASMLDNRHKTPQDTCPIKIRVTYKRERKYYATGKSLTMDEWERLPNGKNRELKEIRESVENSFSLVRMNVEALAERGGFSFDALNVRLGKATGDTINTAFKAKIASLKKEERIGTMSFYHNIFKNTEAFAGSTIKFEDISIDWLKRYEKFLLQTKNHTTVGMHMRAMRVLMNDARKAGIVKETQYPFGKGKYEIQTGEAHKKALNLKQIGQIVHYSDGTETTDLYRDLWFFMYLCNGINVADLVKLKYRNIKDGEICFIRQKTERTTKTIKEIRATITPEMESIIKRRGNTRKPDNYIFPYITDTMDAEQRQKQTKELTKRINMRMKRIGDALGIRGITTYTARHSYATVLKRSGANIAFISESLGHSDLKTTESYLASFEKEEREKNAVLLTNFE